MIGDKQSQSVGDGSSGTQINGNVTINSLCDIEKVMSLVRSEVEGYMRLHREIVHERMDHFEDKIFKKFSNNEHANTNAFSDPDFAHTVQNAAKSYARSGDESVADTLVDLIARRSKCLERNRLALSLNQAVEVAGDLGIEEFSALSFIMAMRYSSLPAASPAGFLETFKKHIVPLIENLPKSRSCAQYLIARRCGYNGVSHWEISNWSGVYRNIFTDGISEDEYEGFSDGFRDVATKENVVVRSAFDASRIVFNLKDRFRFVEFLEEYNFSPEEKERAINYYDGRLWNAENFITNVREKVPDLLAAINVWETADLNYLELTTLGLAVGHGYLRHLTGLDADLSIWIQ